MSIIKTLSVGNGDMFYIKHGSSNFTIIDCNMDENNREDIVNEIISESKNKDITRFISTHPDEDHIHGLKYLDEKIHILNFYCVENQATKKDETEDFKHYCALRDGEHHYYVYKGCKRKWMNEDDDEKKYGSSGINFLWPQTDNQFYLDALDAAKAGDAFNNLSPIFTYSLQNGVTCMWMGDMKHDFLENIQDDIDWPSVDILFAPHHGRDSGKVSKKVLEKLTPKVIIVGEAPSEHLNYYNGYNTLTQNSTGNITFKNEQSKTEIYVENSNYKYDKSFLKNEGICDCELGVYIGTLMLEGK